MPFNILLLPLIGGFFFLHRWNRTKFYAIRYDKERLLLHASFYGIILLVIAFVLEALIPPFIPCVKWFPCLPALPFQYMGVSSLALALGWVLPLLLNLYWNIEDESKRYIEVEGDPFERLINGALDTAKPVMLTLKGGKVYVGFVVSSFTPERETTTIHIAPLRSGYRDEKKQEVYFTTDYSGALDKIPEDIAKLREQKGEAEERYRQVYEQIEKLAVATSEHAAVLVNPISFAADAEGLVKRESHEMNVISALTEEIEALESAIQDFGMIIRIDEITSSTLYNARIHADYFNHSDPE